MPKAVSSLVIGAGIAGITTAKTLIDKGFEDVKILEATDRIGGRIWTVQLESNEKIKSNVELGATYIHGIESNPIFQLADENNLLQLRQQELKSGNAIAVTEDGEELTAKLVQEVDWHYGMLMQECEEFFTQQKPPPLENESVGSYMRREMSRYLHKYTGKERRMRENLFNQRLLHEACLCGSDESMDDVSLAELGSYEELAGSNFLIQHGFESIITTLKRDIPPENIFLNHVVTKIRWNCNDRHVIVECDNGHIFTADHVIVTVSLGYLKSEGLDMFEPPLPAAKVAAVHHLAYGAVDKVVLEFDHNVFDCKYRRIDLLWNDNNIDGKVKDCWYKRLHSFEILNSTTLQAWVTGESALHLESLADSEIIEKITLTLEKFLQHPIAKPKQLIRSRWSCHRFCRGSYMYVPVGASTMDIENLAEPLPLNSPYPTLLFAGEATHPVYYSTTHGAMLTGKREAERIINMYREKETQEKNDDSEDSDAICF